MVKNPMTKTLTILLVDDSSAVRADLRTLINLIEGIEITGEAQDAQSAILTAIDLNPDLVILDLQLGKTKSTGFGWDSVNW